jgi:hypothetical protein
MLVKIDAKSVHDFTPAASPEADHDDWGPHASWPETIATVLVTGVALAFVSFLAVVMGLA